MQTLRKKFQKNNFPSPIASEGWDKKSLGRTSHYFHLIRMAADFTRTYSNDLRVKIQGKQMNSLKLELFQKRRLCWDISKADPDGQQPMGEAGVYTRDPSPHPHLRGSLAAWNEDGSAQTPRPWHGAWSVSGSEPGWWLRTNTLISIISLTSTHT